MRKRKRIQTLLALLTAAAGAWAQATATTSATRTGSNNTYTVKMKEGTKDAAKWTIASDGNSTTGDKTDGLTVAPEKEVTLTYSGRLKVKSVTATHDGWDGDLSNIPASLIGSDGHTVTVPDGTTLTGTLYGETNRYKIVIPDGASVTLADAKIYSANNENCKWAGINCEGNTTIILADNTTNKVEGFYENWPGIYVPGDKDDPSKNKTLIIKGGSDGSGKLEAIGNSTGCGIGGGSNIACGNIIIEGGNIKAEGGDDAAGIGSGKRSSCGDITISGGTIEASGEGHSAAIGSGHGGRCGNILINGGIVTANGGLSSAGIGCAYESSCGNITISGGTVKATGDIDGSGIGCSYNCFCGDITITKDVTLLTVTKGEDSPNSIGLGYHVYNCGTVTIGCELDSEGKPKSGTGTVYYDDDGYQNGGATYLAQSTLTLVNLGKLTGHYEAPNGTTLFGTLNGTTQKYKVSFADGATVTLDGVDIEGVNDYNCQWAGLNCTGDATIILNDGSTNTVKGFYKYYPGIFVPKDNTLTIKSRTADPGKLMASPFDGGTDESYGAGIGGGYEIVCGEIIIQGGIITATGGKWAAGIGGGPDAIWGNITISGGEVTAQGGNNAAGIGSGDCGGESGCGHISITGGTVIANGGENGAGIGSGFGYDSDPSILYSYCGNINISGGTITATGGKNAAGIGTGYQYSQCGNIEITSGVNHVTAKKGDGATESIGKSRIDPQSNNSCGTVTLPDDTSKVTQE